MSNVIGVINDAMMLNGDRRAKIAGGLHIQFNTEQTIISGQIVQIQKGLHYFKVNEVKIDGSNLVVRAHEVGYWARFIERKENFDIRSLLNENVILVTSEDELSKVNEMSCWC